VVAKRGELWWGALPRTRRVRPGYRRPVVVVEADRFNRSGIQTVVVAAVTSTIGLAEAPGNVHMTESLTMSPAVRKMLLSYRDKVIAEGRAEGWQKGLYEGRREGRRAGVLKGKRSALARQLKRKFGPLAKETWSRVRALDSKEVDRYLDRVLDADSLAAMGFEDALPVSTSVRGNRMHKRKATRKALGWGAELKEKARMESWEKGREHGRWEGAYLGLAEGKREALVRQVKAKFGPRLKKTVVSRLRTRWSLRELDRYLDRVLAASSVAEMDFREPRFPPIYEEFFESSAISQ